jgi:hypothetical protein
MNRQDLQAKLAGKNFIFINHLVEALGGSKKGNNTQDIEEILTMFDSNPDKVISAFETAELTRKNRFGKIKNAFHEVRTHWEQLVLFVENSKDVPEAVHAAIEFIDNIVDTIFPIKD